jgi:ribosomal protein S18 acetylase RimI-like enzyme
MRITARRATMDDVAPLLELYHELETEQTAIKPMWRLADGLAEPAEETLAGLLRDPDSVVVIGEIEGVALGFAWARSEPLLPQAGDVRVAVVRLIHTTLEARGVGVGDAMVRDVLAEFRSRGHRLFDARVSPGHRLAKNFFESNGFSARLIVMHHSDGDDE